MVLTSLDTALKPLNNGGQINHYTADKFDQNHFSWDIHPLNSSCLKKQYEENLLNDHSWWLSHQNLYALIKIVLAIILRYSESKVVVSLLVEISSVHDHFLVVATEHKGSIFPTPTIAAGDRIIFRKLLPFLFAHPLEFNTCHVAEDIRIFGIRAIQGQR